ncbi:EI24 domain-containing protein [Aureitalea marina]|uniref:Coproporphyrinogen III oxidase n=1 Tax=Aureitalea marina TaxID=930804 RepID=A0A2S7KSD0_9FLAO|nr:EI24 domain-containing protein [Aureitalea marina]PQB05539.1 coproporphyrinogen III oxidase [Aureitalea marina]
MIGSILDGIKAYGVSFRLLGELGLWRYFFVPMGISLFIAANIILATWGWSDNLGEWIAGIWVWDWGKVTFAVISEILGGVIIFILGLIVYKHLVMALSAPFMSPVSEAIEKHLNGEVGGKLHKRFFPQLRRGIQINIRNLFMELLLSIPVLLLGFVPIIGVASTVLLFLLQSYYAGFGNMDYTLERHMSVKESIQFVKARRGLAIGNGVPFMLLLLIPIVGVILVLPLSVTASSYLTVQELTKETQDEG